MSSPLTPPLVRRFGFASVLILAMISAFTVGQSAAALTAAEALDQPDWTFSTVPADRWTPLAAPSLAHDGVDVLRVTPRPDGFASQLSTTVQGPGFLSFHWKLLGGAPGSARWRCGVGLFATPLAAEAQLTEPNEWERVVLPVPLGSVGVTWEYTLNGSISVTGRAALIDDVAFTPTPEVSLGEALDQAGLPWTATDPSLWSGRLFAPPPSALAQQDAAVLTWPAIPGATGSKTTSLSTVVTGPANVSFRALTTASIGVAVGGNTVVNSTSGTLSQSKDWRDVSFAVPQGESVVAITFRAGALSTMAWVDAVTIDYTEESRLSKALDTPEINWTVGAAAPPAVTFDPNRTHDGVDAVIWPGYSLGAEGIVASLPGSGAVRVTGWARYAGDLYYGYQKGNLAWSEFAMPILGGTGTQSEWRQFSFVVPAGSTAMMLRPRFSSAVVIVDELKVMPIQQVAAAEAVDAPALTWTVPSPGWEAVTDGFEAEDGLDLLRSVTPSSGAGPARAEFTGEGVLSFSWFGATGTKFGLDDRWKWDALASSQWSRVSVELPPGDHRAMWTAGGVGMRLDRVDWKPKTGVTVGAAMDCPEVAWLMEGAEPWGTAATGPDGGSVATSPALRPGQTSRLVAMLPGAGPFSFKWRTTGAPAHLRVASVGDGLTQSFNGLATTPPLGLSPEWKTHHFSQSGFSRVVFEVTPAGVDSLPAGAVQLDQLAFEHQERRTVDGPFEVSFRWSAPSIPDAQGKRSMSFEVDGETRAATTDAVVGQRVVVTGYRSGPHRLVWKWSGSAENRLTDVAITAFGAAGSLSAALDAPDIDSCVVGECDFGGGPAVGDASDGVDALRVVAGSVLTAWCPPGRELAWQWRHDSPDQRPVFSRRRSSASDAGGFRPASPTVVASPTWAPAAAALAGTEPYVVTWTMENGANGTESLWIDQLSHDPIPTRPFGTWLGSPEIVWDAQPVGAWQLSTPTLWDSTHDSDGYIASGSAQAKILATVTGPAILWAQASDYGLNTVVDGNETFLTRTGFGWRLIGAGTHTVGVSRASVSFSAVLDTLRVMPLTTVEDALDWPAASGIALTAVPAGSLGVRTPDVSAVDGDVFFSPPLTSTPAVLRAAVAGPARLRFRQASLGYGGNLSVLLDGSLAGRIAGSVGYVDVPAGTHTVEWVMTSGSGIADERYMLDGVVLESLVPVPSADLASALDAPDEIVATTAGHPLAVEADPSAVNGTLLRSPWLPANATTSLQMNASAPDGALVGLRWQIETAPPTAVPMSLSLSGRADGSPISLHWWNRSSLADVCFVHLGALDPTTPLVFRTDLPGPFSSPIPNLHRLSLDELIVIPDSTPSLPLNSALGVSDLTVTSPSAAQWRGVSAGTGGPRAVATGGTNTPSVMQCTLPGPGTLSFRWKLDPPDAVPAGTGGRFHAAGRQIAGATTSWATVRRYHLPTETSVRWDFSDTRSAELLSVQNAVWQPSPRVTLTDALDVAPATVTTGGAAPWIGVAEPAEAADGTDAAVSPALAGDESAWVEANFSGAAVVSYRYRLTAASRAAFFVTVDGGEPKTLGGTAWAEGSVIVRGSGTHTVRWTFTSAGGVEAAWLDMLRVTPMPEDRLAEALGLPSSVAVSSIGVYRSSAEFPPAVGPEAVAFADVTSSLSFPVTGPALVSYAYRSPSRTAVVLVDGVQIPPPPANPSPAAADVGNGWFRGGVFVPAGDHTVAWRAPSSVTVPAFALDDVIVTPGSPLSALDIPGAVEWRADASSGWQGFAPGGLSHGALAAGSTALVHVRLQGPGMFRFTALPPVGVPATTTFVVDGVASDMSAVSVATDLSIPAGEHVVSWLIRPLANLSPTSHSPFQLHDVTWIPGASPSAAALGLSSAVASVPRASSLSLLQDATGSFVRHTPSSLSDSDTFFGFFPPARGTLDLKSRGSADEPWNSSSTFVSGSSFVKLPTAGKSQDFSALLFRPLTNGFAEAVDATDLTLSAQPMSAWHGVISATSSRDGSDALVWSPSRDGESAPVTCEVTGPGTLRFSWRHTGTPQLTLFVDGTETPSKSGSSWTSLDVSLPAGLHELRWSPAPSAAPSGEAALDQMAWIPPTSPECLVLTPDSPPIVANSGKWNRSADSTGRLSLVPVQLVPLMGAGTTQWSFLPQLNLLLIPEGECYFRFTQSSGFAPPYVQFTLTPSSGLAPEFPGTRNRASEGLWLFGPRRRVVTLQASLQSLYPVPHAPAFANVTEITRIPLQAVSAAEALDSPLPVTLSGPWEGVRAGSDGPDVLRARVETAPSLSIPLPSPGSARIIANTEAGSIRLLSSGGEIDAMTASGSYAKWLTSPWPLGGRTDAVVAADAAPAQSGWLLLDQLGFEPSPVVTNYAEWLAASVGYTGSDAAPTADPDGDGRPNLLEYAVGSDPASMLDTLTLAPEPSVASVDATPRAVLSWRVLPRRDLAFTVESWDAASGTWNSAVAGVSSAQEPDGWMRFTATASEELSGPELWRLRVSIVTP